MFKNKIKQHTTSQFVFIFLLIILLNSCNIPGSMVEEQETQSTVLTTTTGSATPTPTLTYIAEPTATNTLVPTFTPDPDIEVVDEALAEQIRAAMPDIWVYDRKQKQFVVRSNEDFQFTIYKRTTLYITDGNGEEVGYARYFSKTTLDSENTQYYSLTDKSVNSLIPMKLYSQMGEFKAATPGMGGLEVEKCMFAFSEDFHILTTDFKLPQQNIDWKDKYANDTLNISNGDEMVQKALIRTIALIKEEDEEKIYADLMNGVPIILSFDGKEWEVNKGINFIWGDTFGRSYEVKDGLLILDSSGANDKDTCIPGSWDEAFPALILWKYFEKDHIEITRVYNAVVAPPLNTWQIKMPVICEQRP